MTLPDFDPTTFNPTAVEPPQFKPIEPGPYLGQITELAWHELKSGEGKRLQVRIELFDNNRWVFDSLNLVHPKEEQVGYAQYTLSQIMSALGVAKLSPDMRELLHKPVTVNVGIDRKDTTRNRVNGYLPAKSKPPAPVAPPPAMEQDDIPF